MAKLEREPAQIRKRTSNCDLSLERHVLATDLAREIADAQRERERQDEFTRQQVERSKRVEAQPQSCARTPTLERSGSARSGTASGLRTKTEHRTMIYAMDEIVPARAAQLRNREKNDPKAETRKCAAFHCDELVSHDWDYLGLKTEWCNTHTKQALYEHHTPPRTRWQAFRAWRKAKR